MTTVSEQLVSLSTDQKSVEFDGLNLPLYEIGGDKGAHQYFLAAIPVELLQRDEEAQPREYSERQAQKIAESIRKKVLMQPIMVRYSADRNEFLITEGQHRWRAVMDVLKEERIPCMVYVDLERELALLCGLEANAEDRAKALSGGDLASKTHALMREYRQLLEKEREDEGNTEPVTEMDVLERMGHLGKADQKKFLLGKTLEDITETSKLRGGKVHGYVSDRQSSKTPMTFRTFGNFIGRLAKLAAVGPGEEDVREQELENVYRVSENVSEILFGDGKWGDEDSTSHRHAVNVCRWHCIEAAGHFIAKAIERAGGRDATLGACYVPTEDINWEQVRSEMERILLSPAWDYEHIWPQRNVEKLIELLDRELRK